MMTQMRSRKISLLWTGMQKPFWCKIFHNLPRNKCSVFLRHPVYGFTAVLNQNTA